ncbi:MAG: hypothetical protein E7323_08080 [Clostridiales bacterium]|nr:hypothetical protein [Clostridiales bacterium]
MNRRWSVLSALLATALLLVSMPGLVQKHLSSPGRTDERLRPAASRTLVVWVSSWLEEDRQLISSLCADFEKQRPGVRLYLRRVDAAELNAPGAVLPDVLLHTTGDVLSPGDTLLPLPDPEGVEEGLLASGKNRGTLYGIPLWYSPLVLTLPKVWFQEETPAQADDPGKAYFSLATPVPEKQPAAVTLADVPWPRMLESGSAVCESGLGLPVLLLHCPSSLRAELAALTPALRRPEGDEAGICSLSASLAREKEAFLLPLPPPIGQKVRYVSLCRSGEDAEALLAFLLSGAVQGAAAENHLVPTMAAFVPEGSWVASIAAGGAAFVPNAFQMEASAMEQLCIQDFRRREDPVATLLKLR